MTLNTSELKHQEIKKTVENASEFGYHLGMGMVYVLVGPTQQPFRVHKNLLCAKVPYFEKMFNSDFEEGKTQSAKLPEDDPDAFALFLEWLYGGRFLPVDDKKIAATTGPFISRIRLYGFADKVLLPDLKDYCITSLIAIYKRLNPCFPNHAKLTTAYEVTPPGSRLRTFMAASMFHLIRHQGEASQWTVKVLSESLLKSQEMTADVLLLFRGPVPQTGPQGQPKCTWHVHGKSESCPVRDDML